MYIFPTKTIINLEKLNQILIEKLIGASLDLFFGEAWHFSVSVVCVYNNHKLRIYCLVQEGYLEN